MDYADKDRYVELISAGGANTLRDEAVWPAVERTKGTFDWSFTDAFMTNAAKKHLRVLLVADQSPGWASGHPNDWSWSMSWLPPVNPMDYGNFAGRLAARYGRGGVFWKENPLLPLMLPAGIEIWNEPNIARFWGGRTPDPAKYTALLKAAYTAIKAADPTMAVITGGLAPEGGYDDVTCSGATASGGGASRASMNGLNFIESVYARGGRGYFDAIGWHPYNFTHGATATQMLAYHRCSAWSQMNATTPSVRSLMTRNGDSSKKIWATEAGAPTCVSEAKYSCVSEVEQANLVSEELNLWKSYSWAGGYYWYDIRDDAGGTSRTDMDAHFGSVRGNNTLKPAYSALRKGFRSQQTSPASGRRGE